MIVAGSEWVAVIDTGFNGDLELPEALAPHFPAHGFGESETTLGGGNVIMEDLFFIEFPFDGELVEALVAFAPVGEILIGTNLLRNYRLEVNFVTGTVSLEKVVVS
jgi:predicted aspartyl protease